MFEQILREDHSRKQHQRILSLCAENRSLLRCVDWGWRNRKVETEIKYLFLLDYEYVTSSFQSHSILENLLVMSLICQD